MLKALLAESWQNFATPCTQHCACFVAEADYPAAPAGYLPQSGNILTTSAAANIPTAPKPTARLLTEPEQKANLHMEKALHASTAAAKLTAVRLSLRAAFVSLQQAASKTLTGDANVDR